MRACISIDLEEFEDSVIWQKTGKSIEMQKSVERITSFLDENELKATFFVLGTFAEKYSSIVKKLRNDGHEIGSHFYSHQNLYELGDKEIEIGIKRSINVLGKVRGFRAPMYTMDMRTIEILKKNGFKYDSSVFPSVVYPHPSIKKIDKNLRIDVLKKSEPYEVNGIFEIPLTVFPSYLGLPVTGTTIRLFGKFIARLIPFFRGEVFLINMHPFEFMDEIPKIEGVPFWFGRNIGKRFEMDLKSIVSSLKKRDAEFVRMGDLV